MTLLKLPKEDDKLRFELLQDADRLLSEENIKINEFTNDELIDFILTWHVEDRIRTKVARALLSVWLEKEECTVRQWIKKNYSFNRMYVLYEFSNYCSWISPSDIINHFGESLNIFLSIYGETPNWCTVPYHLLIRVAYTDVWIDYRTKKIKDWIEEHWEKANQLFSQFSGVPDEDFPYIPGVEWHHFYTVYKHVTREHERRDLRSFRESNPDKYKELKEQINGEN